MPAFQPITSRNTARSTGALPDLRDVVISPSYTESIARLFAPAFDVSDEERIGQAAAVVIGYDRFCSSIDNITDSPQTPVTELHQGALALADATAIAAKIVQEPARFFGAAQRYLHEASEAEQYLWRHRNVRATFEPLDFDMLGRKNAILKVAPAVLAGMTNNWSVLPDLERAIEDMSTCVQLLDDLFDWQEDFEAGYYSYPLQIALGNRTDFTVTEVGDRVFSREVLGPTITAAIERFTRATERLVRANLAPHFPWLVEARHSLSRLHELARRETQIPAAAFEQQMLAVRHPIFAYVPG